MLISELKKETVTSYNFVEIFCVFENCLNNLFQGQTELLQGGRIRVNKSLNIFHYEKMIKSKGNVTVEVDIIYNKVKDDYLYYSYNIIFDSNKLLLHYEPSHKENFQPHINIYTNNTEFQNSKGESIHILSHMYHPFEILLIIKRYFV